jgi:hypothetical protein
MKNEQYHSIHLGKLSIVSGVLALLAIITLLSTSSWGESTIYRSAIILFFNVTQFFSDPVMASESVLKPVGLFDISERNIRVVLVVITTLFTLFAGVLATYAAKRETNSFHYSVGFYFGLTSAFELNIFFAAFYMIFFVIILRSRKSLNS